MSLFASLAGRRLSRASVSMPYYGCWLADVESEEDLSSATGIVSLVLGTLTLRGTIVTRGEFAGDRRARVVAGAGGWRVDVPALGYSNAAGVRAATVLGDLAALVGETIAGVSATTTLGPHYARPSGPAASTLRDIAGPSWYVDAAGVTQVGARPTSAIPSATTVVARDPATGLVTVATEAPGDWLPGRTFATVTTPVSSVRYTRLTSDNSGKLRVDVLATEVAA